MKVRGSREPPRSNRHETQIYQADGVPRGFETARGSAAGLRICQRAPYRLAFPPERARLRKEIIIPPVGHGLINAVTVEVKSRYRNVTWNGLVAAIASFSEHFPPNSIG
jgi:hypothetical protein